MPRKSKIQDIEALERDYRAGMLSLREIGRLHGITDGYIRKIAHERDWERDLGAQVRNRVRSDALKQGEEQSEEEIIQGAAAKGVSIVRKHQRIIDKMLGAVEALGEDSENIGKMGDPDKDRITNRLGTLTQSLSKLIPLERQAQGLDAPEGERDTDALRGLSASQLREFIRKCAEDLP